MKLLLDENVPRPLRRELPGHTVRTVQEMGWAGVKNGALLGRAELEGFEALLTYDRNLEHQQDLRGRRMAIVVLVAPSNTLPDLVPLVPSLRTLLSTLQPGEIQHVTRPPALEPDRAPEREGAPDR